MNDAAEDASMSIQVERMPYVDLEMDLPATTETSVALHLSGRCLLEWATGGRPSLARPSRGDITIVPADRPGRLRIRGGPCEVIKLRISNAMLRNWAEVQERVWSGNPFVDSFMRPDRLLQQISLALLREAERSETVDTFYWDALVNALLAHLLRCYSERADKSASGRRVHPLSSHRTQRAIDMMESDLTRPVGLDDIARELGISPSHCSAQFKQRQGRTPGRYLTWLRLDRARELLEGGRFDVREVAEQVGYTSASHFAQAFRAEFGETPGTWRAR